ncbi:MAG: hypothetical protein ACXW2A_13415 [Burkholderiales bacterium]
MKLSLNELDQEIREIETRIALERLALDDAVSGCTNSLRDTVSSPKTLLALAGIGFVLGKLMFGKKAPQQQVVTPQKAGLLGLLTGLAGTAMTLMQPGFGVGSVARWAAQRAFAKKPARAAPAAPLSTVPPTTAPPARPRRIVAS